MAKGDIEIAIDANASGAIKGFKQTETAAQRAANTIHKGAKIAAVGFAVVGVAALKLAQGAADDQKAAVALATQLKNTTGATKAQVAATEAWISKQGQLTGITDDELRPAIGRLATATGSIEKAQRLALLAQNVSIGTGKKYGTVVEALAKAQNGNIGALGRLGFATKDAHGKTKSLAAIQKDLADKFKGQAGKQADTLAGKMQILRTQLSEAGESIGYALIPPLTNLANFAVQKVLPAITAVGKWMSDHKPIAIAIGAAVAAFGAAFIVASVAMKVYAASTTISTVATAAFSTAKGIALALVGAETVAIEGNTVAMAAYGAVSKVTAAAQWALNAALSANPIGLVIIAIIALVAAIVLAWKHSETFRAIVTGAFSAVRVAASAAFGWVKKNWPLLLAIITGPIGLAVLAVTKNWDAIKNSAGAAVDWIRTKFTGLVGFFKGIPGKIRNIFSGLWTGLADGLKSAINSVLHLPLTIPTIDTHIPGVGKVGGQTLIPALAKGGIVTRPTLALLGDNPGHREAVIPLSGPDAQQHLGRSFTIENVNITAAPNEPIHSSLPRAIATLDLLYGAA